MNLNLTTSEIMRQPISLQAIPANEVSKSIDSTKASLEKIEKELNLHQPKASGSFFGKKITVISSGHSGSANATNQNVTATKISKLKEIKSSIEKLANDLKIATKEFEVTLQQEIAPVVDTITRLKDLCELYLAKHQETLSIQERLVHPSLQNHNQSEITKKMQ